MGCIQSSDATNAHANTEQDTGELSLQEVESFWISSKEDSGSWIAQNTKDQKGRIVKATSEKEQRKLELQRKAFEQHEVFWVCHRDTLSTMKRLVKFEEAQQRNLLVQLPPYQKALFLSHRWLRDSHPDNKKQQKYDAIVFLLNDDCWIDAEVEFFWLDYMCISQQDRKSQTKAVNSLPFYIKSCQYFISLYGDEQIGDRALMHVYDGRGWCRLERFVALATMSVQTYTFNMITHNLQQTTIDSFQISTLNPMFGVFRDGGIAGDNEKMRIAPMLSHLCNFASQYGGVAAIRELAKDIQDSIALLSKDPFVGDSGTPGQAIPPGRQQWGGRPENPQQDYTPPGGRYKGNEGASALQISDGWV